MFYKKVSSFSLSVFSSKSGAINLCLEVINIVLLMVSLLLGNLIFSVVIVFVISKTLSTLKSMPFIFSLLQALYRFYMLQNKYKHAPLFFVV